MILLERGYTLSEAYALWRQRGDVGVVTTLAEHLEDDELAADGPAMSDGSDEE
jgi:hypothetical protein